MKVPWEDKLPCAALALLVLAVFYGIYFAKMLAQKRRGIQTRQIGRRREKDIHTVEVLMSMATLGAPIAQLLSIAFGWSHLPANARFTGFCIGMLGGAVWCLGTAFSYIAAGKAGAAISYALGQGAPMIAAVWGVFIWKEFKGADRKTNTLLAVMFLFFIAGLASIIASGGN